MKGISVIGYIFFALVIGVFIGYNLHYPYNCEKQIQIQNVSTDGCNNDCLIEDSNWETYEAFGWYNYTINRSELKNYTVVYCDNMPYNFTSANAMNFELFNYSVLADMCNERNLTMRFINNSYRVCYNQTWRTVPKSFDCYTDDDIIYGKTTWSNYTKLNESSEWN